MKKKMLIILAALTFLLSLSNVVLASPIETIDPPPIRIDSWDPINPIDTPPIIIYSWDPIDPINPPPIRID